MIEGEKTVRELTPGEWFTLKPVAHPKESQVFIREEYDRSEKKYWCQRFSDSGDGKLLKGDRKVYTDFIF